MVGGWSLDGIEEEEEEGGEEEAMKGKRGKDKREEGRSVRREDERLEFMIFSLTAPR